MKKKLIKIVLVLLLLMLLGFAAILFFRDVFKISKIEIEGNSYYTKEEMEDYLLSQTKYDNSLYLWWVFRSGREEKIPYIDTMEFEFLRPDEIRVTVYEKSIVGYFDYLGTHFYFDKDGMLVDSSDEILQNIPQVKGIMFDKLVLYEKIPVENDEIFKSVVDTANILNGAELYPDEICFNKKLEITLDFGDVSVLLGDSADLNEKVNRLAGILPKLEGEKGILYLNDSSNGGGSVRFIRSEDEKDTI